MKKIVLVFIVIVFLVGIGLFLINKSAKPGNVAAKISNPLVDERNVKTCNYWREL